MANAIHIHNMRRLLQDREDLMYTYKFDRETTNTLMNQAIANHHIEQLQKQWSEIPQQKIEEAPCEGLNMIMQEKERLEFLVESDRQQKKSSLELFDLVQAEQVEQNLQKHKELLEQTEETYNRLKEEQEQQEKQQIELQKKQYQLQAYEIVKSYIDKLSIDEIDILLSKQQSLRENLGDYYDQLQKERVCLKK